MRDKIRLESECREYALTAKGAAALRGPQTEMAAIRRRLNQVLSRT